MTATTPSPHIQAAVLVAEHIATLPAVATQDWCDRAAAALLRARRPALALVMIAQVDPTGLIVRHEATGVAGAANAEVITTVGRTVPQASSSIIEINPADPRLARLRASLEQADRLGYRPGSLEAGEVFASTIGAAETGHDWRASPAGRRWDEVGASDVLLAAISLGDHATRRVLVAEVGLIAQGLRFSHEDAEVLHAVMPVLARRAVQAIGEDPSDSGHWLTPKEQVILQHLLLGKSVRQIADELARSPHTVHDHVKSLHRKLNASSRGELVARALGYVELKPSPRGGADRGGAEAAEQTTEATEE